MRWELFPRHGDRGFEMVGVDGDLLDHAPVAGLATAVEVAVAAPSTRPDATAPTDAAIETTAARLGGRVVASIRSEAELWVLVHLPSPDGATDLAATPAPPGGQVAVTTTHDPDWTRFDRARPTGMEVQAMLDHRRLAALHRRGDRGGVRTVEHAVSGVGPGEIDALQRSLVALGLSPQVAADEDGTSTFTVAQEIEPREVTPDAWTIRVIAEGSGASYDGWTCPVLESPAPAAAPRRPTSPSRTGWWRRRARSDRA